MSKKINAYVYIRFGSCEEIMSEEEMQKKLFEEYLQKREKIYQ